MLEIDKLHCTGCGACVQRCPKHCITFCQEELGHIYPLIDPKECIDCGLCEKVCPIELPKEKLAEQKVYAAVNKDHEVLMNSTSGGFFTALAKLVLSQGGVVYGCSFEGNFQAKHIRVDNAEKLAKLRGSKYLQSNTGNTFLEAEKDLKNGTLVLYTGTPCQIAGLKAFLRKPYNNLLTVDIVCHGVGSQAFFDKYLEFLQNKKGKLKALNFRDKKMAGWSCGGGIVLEKQGKEVRKHYFDYDNYYYYYFLHGDIYRDSCYSCKYANTDRPGDFTMGDFWGVEKYNLSLNTINGCSLVIANTSKAKKYLEQMTDILDLAEATMEQATKANAQLIHPSEPSKCRRDLTQKFENMNAQEINRAFKKQNREKIFKLYLKAMVPYKLKAKIRKLR